MCNFTHLHVHSHFSRFDGWMTIASIFKQAFLHNMKAVALTDHHNVFSWFPMIELSKNFDMKPLYGCELNVGNYHITALAVNQIGLKNIICLNNIGQLRKPYPSITEKELITHKEGLFLLSGCSRGKISSLVSQNNLQGAIQTLESYQCIFKDHFALEVQNYGQMFGIDMMNTLLNLSISRQISVIPTNDCHYLNEKDGLFHHKLLLLKTKGKAKKHAHTQNYFKSEEEMEKNFPRFLLEKTRKIEQQCEADFYEYIKKQEGSLTFPLSDIRYYDDATALRDALYVQEEYKLGNAYYKQMKKHDLLLENIPKEEEMIVPLTFAFRLRGRIHSIQASPTHYIKSNAWFPFYTDSQTNKFIAQVDTKTAERLDLPIYQTSKSFVSLAH